MRQIRVRIGSKLPPLDGEIGPALAAQIVMREALGEIRNATDPDEIAKIDEEARRRKGERGNYPRRWTFPDGSYIVTLPKDG